MLNEMMGVHGEDRLYALLAMQMNAIPQEDEGIIYHYTSPGAVESILFRQDGKGHRHVTLWASRYDCLNDSSEGSIADKIYKETISAMRQSGEISEAMYKLCAKAKAYDKGCFSHYDEEGSSDKIWISKSERFVASFSKNPDSLAMWKYYSKGNGYEGVNLGFSLEAVWDSLEQNGIEPDNIKISSVIYDRKEQTELIRKAVQRLQAIFEEELEPGYAVKNAEISDHISYLLTDWKLIFKSEFFRHEEEVRIIVDVSREKQGEKCNLPIEYRYSNGYWIPYIKLVMSPESLKQVTLGPLGLDENQKKRQRGIVLDMLRAKGYRTQGVRWSEIPVRY